MYLTRRVSLASLLVLLLLVVVAAYLVYQVSPLRDPSFQPNSANAGSLLPGFRVIKEGNWLLGANLLAGLLATNFVLIIYQYSQFFTINSIRRSQGLSKKIASLLAIVVWAGLWAVIFGGCWMLFLGYLLSQWLVD